MVCNEILATNKGSAPPLCSSCCSYLLVITTLWYDFGRVNILLHSSCSPTSNLATLVISPPHLPFTSIMTEDIATTSQSCHL